MSPTDPDAATPPTNDGRAPRGPPPPRVFRILLPARDLAASTRFYESLLGVPSRLVAEGRVYLDCGRVILGLLDYSEADPSELRLPTEAVYLATDDLEGVHRRARELGSLSAELLHGDPGSPMGEIVVRPWGERSFYADDPTGNPLCFVDSSTVFTGTPEQVDALRRVGG
ncbi:MAG TPA: VOC family protein [Thermoplasmata archaeon]|nr:VOC family protein [Thermoplasmata archaeon]